MSKAFTKEDAAGDEEPLAYTPPWPTGARNYITAAGHARLLAERDVLLAARSTDATAKRRLEILNVHLEAAEVVAAPSGTCERVQFGTRVTVNGDRTYAIVGVDEVDVANGRVSWLSPIARALRGARVGDVVTLRTPRGEEELEVLAIDWLA